MSEFDALNHEHSGKGIVCRHVSERERPLLEIWHLPDGTWDFLCGEDDHDSIDDADLICADCTLEILSIETGLAKVERCTVAFRNEDGAPWQIRSMTDAEIAECFQEN